MATIPNFHDLRAQTKPMKKLILIFLVYLLCSPHSFSQQWEDLATLSNPANLPQMTAANGKIYVVSGIASGENPAIQEYDPTTDTWTAKAVIPKGCYWSSAISVAGKIYVMGGGHPYPGQKYNFIYDPVADTWTQGAELIDGRMYHSAASANGKIYLMGGQNGDNKTEWYFDEYDPVTDSWTRKAQLPNNGAWYSGATGMGNYVYRIAGGGSSIHLTRDHFDRYNITTDSWDVLTAFRTPIHAPKAVNYKGNIILIGGYSNGYIDSMFSYDVVADEWSAMDLSLPDARSYHSAAVIDDCIYVYGGHNDALKGTLIRHCDPYLGIEEKLSSNLHIDIYPNPIKEVLSLTINSISSSEASIIITNMIGDICFSERITIKAGNNNQRIRLSELPSGIYMVSVIVVGQIVNSLFVKY